MTELKEMMEYAKDLEERGEFAVFRPDPESPLYDRSTSEGGRSHDPFRARLDSEMLGGNREQRRQYVREAGRPVRCAYGLGKYSRVFRQARHHGGLQGTPVS